MKFGLFNIRIRLGRRLKLPGAYNNIPSDLNWIAMPRFHFEIRHADWSIHI